MPSGAHTGSQASRKMTLPGLRKRPSEVPGQPVRGGRKGRPGTSEGLF